MPVSTRLIAFCPGRANNDTGDSEEAVIKYCEKLDKLYKVARVLKQSQRVPGIEE